VNAVRTSGSPRTIIALLSISAMVVSLLAASPAPATNDCTSPPAVMPTSQLVSGMKGSGVTTIRGTTPTPFEVEVLGVMDNYIWLDIPAIVVRITGPDTFLDEVGGVFYGMSGSPVSVNGKLIGSVSYAVSWDPTIVGLTPAQAMVDLFELEKAGAPSLPEQIPFDDATRRSIAAATGRSPSEVVGGLQLLPTYLGVSGLSAARLTELQGMLDERGSRFQLVPASGMSANLPVTSTRFVAGQPIGSVLSWGDVTVWAAGTVAIACADEVVAFGHSLFWSPPGELAIGMTGAEVLAVGTAYLRIVGPAYGCFGVGFALYFFTFSTFKTRPTLYLEDLFVVPEERGSGIGRRLLVELARIAVARGCGRMEWSVLDWNTPARKFYFKLGAVAMDEWTVFRMTPEAFGRLAREGTPGDVPDEAV